MTIRELSKYHNTKLEIPQLEDTIKELETTIIGSSKVNGMPSSHNIESTTERTALKIVHLKDKLEKKKESLVDEQEKIENFLDSVEDVEIRLIIRKRFLEGKSWQVIGKESFTDRTTPYYKLKKYLKNHSKEVENDNT